MTSLASDLEINQEDAVQSVVSSQLQQDPIKFNFKTIGYNGKFWLAGSNDIVRKKTLYTYSNVTSLIGQYYSYGTFVKELQGRVSTLEFFKRVDNSSIFDASINFYKGKVNSARIAQKTLLSQAVSSYKSLKSLNYPTAYTEFNTLHTLAKSTDGYSWKLIEANPFQPEVRLNGGTLNNAYSASVNAIIWNSTLALWIAVGCSRKAENKRWVINGYNYTYSDSPIGSYDNLGSINKNGLDNEFTITTNPTVETYSYGSQTIISTSPDGENWTQYSSCNISGDYRSIAYGVACSSNLTIVVGSKFTKLGTTYAVDTYSSVLKSNDGKIWDPIVLSYESILGNIGTQTIGLKAGYGVAYNGVLWVIVGRGTSTIVNNANLGSLAKTCLFTSPDGTTWTSRTLPNIPVETLQDTDETGFRLNSVAWNGSLWITVGNNATAYTSTDGYTWINISSQTFNIGYLGGNFKSVAWDGNFWIITDVLNTYRSKDSIIWERINIAGGGSCIATKIPLPILGGSILTVNSIIVGMGSPSSIIRSDDNTKWYPQIFDITKTNYAGQRKKVFSDVVWTGTNWIVVGDSDEGNFNNNIAKSSDGIDWSFPTNPLTKCNAIGWNGTHLIVVGERNPYGETAITSTNGGSTWTAINLQSMIGNCIAWNGIRWIIGGSEMKTSTNGLDWTTISCPLNIINSIAWNGYTWVAVGSGLTHSIAMSIDGIHWYIANPATNPFNTGYSIAWNKSYWLAVGGGNIHTIAKSVDGYTWTGMFKDVFETSGSTISWTGTSWIATGVGNYPIATSTDGTNWTRAVFPINQCIKYATKDITLPYTGVANQAVLNAINSGTTSIVSSTNSTIAAEEAVIKLAQDEIASAAALALETATRLSSKNTAILYRIKFLFWKKKLENQYNELIDKTYVDIESLYPSEFIFAKSIVEKIDIYVTEGQYSYEKVISASTSLNDISVNLARLETFNSLLESNLLQFYNNSRLLFKYFVDEKYTKYVTNGNILNLIDNYGLNTSDKNIAINTYNSYKSTLDTKRTSSNIIFNTEITTITYSLDYPTSVLIDANITDYVSGFGITSGIIYNRVVTNVPDLYSAYTDANVGSIILMKEIFEGASTYKIKADDYVSNTLDIASKWASVTGGSTPTTEINDAFNPLYTKYFFNPDSNLFYSPLNPIKVNLVSEPLSIKYFKIISEDYSHPSQYDTELTTLYGTLKDKLDSLETTRITAINYARNLRNTTIKDKLTEFFNTTKTNYTTTLGIDTHIQSLCNLTYYSNSSYVTANNFAKMVRVASVAYPVLYPYIRAVKWADAEAEDDGCTAPSTGWGTQDQNLPVDQRGKQGRSGWIKYNETIYSRQRLADHIRTHGGNTPGNYVNYTTTDGYTSSYMITWKDFLNFTETFTYSMLKDSIDDLTNTVDTLNTSSAFVTGVMDSIVNNDLIEIQNQVISKATTYLGNLLTSVTEILPSEEDLTTFGDVTVNGSASLQSMSNSINSTYDSLTTSATVSLTGKTNNEIKSIVENAITYRDTIKAIETSEAYTTILAGIPIYKSNLQTVTSYIELMEDQITRWTRMKANAIANTPFIQSGLRDSTGKPFIVSVLPTNQNYWTQRTYSVYYNLETREYEECTKVNDTIVTSLSPLDITDYSAYSTTRTYNVNDTVSYNNKIYQCIRDGTDDYKDYVLANLSTNTSSMKGPYNLSNGYIFVQGVVPTNTSRWKRIFYPYVEFNGEKIEASPDKLRVLDVEDYDLYSPVYNYSQGQIVRYAGSIYQCILDLKNINKIKGILPTNNNYWLPVTYPTVVYNNIEIEASPSNLPALNLSNFEEYSSTKTYYKGNFIKENSKIYEFVEYTLSGKTVLSSTGSSPADNENSRWIERTYPVVYVNGVKTEATPGTFSALNIANYMTYSDNTYYYKYDYTKYNNVIYCCTLKNKSTLVNVSVLNTEYWKKITFPTVFYNGVLTEAIPGAIPPLNFNDYNSYDNKARYVSGNIVKYDNNVYECINSMPTSIGIRNNLPTNTNYWVERKYPYIVMNNVNIEADPNNGVFVELNQLDFHKYQSGFLYYIGDLVAYNGNVYECTNATPPLIEAVSITDIPPTNTDRWTKLTNTLETTYNIQQWQPITRYVTGTTVSYNGKIYQCETPSRNDIPINLGIYWRELTNYTKLNIPELYSSFITYGLRSVVAYRESATNLSNNQTHVLNFYICSSTEDGLSRYTYDTLYTLDEVDENNNYKYGKRLGNWKDYSIPRYGLPEDDPFNIPMFAANLRRKVAMDIELPYGNIKYNTDQFNYRIKTFLKPYLTSSGYKPNPNNLNSYEEYYNIIPSNALTVYNALEARGTDVCNEFNTLESTTISIYNLVKKAYTPVYEFLDSVFKDIDLYSERIKTIKEVYFEQISSTIWDNPYKYMNPIAFAKSPPIKQFRDLGIGDIREMEDEVNNGNQMNYTTQSIREYYERKATIDLLEEQIGTLMFVSKLITGFPVLLKMVNSSLKMGARIPCLLDGWTDLYPTQNMEFPAGYGPYINIETPITDYDIFSKWGMPSLDFTGTPSGPNIDTIVYKINQIIKSSVKPPAYIADPTVMNDLELATYESKNGLVKGLGAFAKGVVGLTAATFRNFIDPWQVTGAVEFVLDVVTNTYDHKILSFVPEGNWPAFNERTNDIAAFKSLTDIERRKISESKEEESEQTLAYWFMFVGKLLRLNEKDLKVVNDIEAEYRDYEVIRKTKTTTIPIPDPPNPPVGYIPPDIPKEPVTKLQLSKSDLIAERESLLAMRRNLNNRLNNLRGIRPPVVKFIPIPEAVYEEVKSAISGTSNPPDVSKPVSKWGNTTAFGADASATRFTPGTNVQSTSGLTFNGLPTNTTSVKPKLAPVAKAEYIVKNQKDIDNAISLRETAHAEFKAAYADYKLKNAEMLLIKHQLKDVNLKFDNVNGIINDVDLKNALIEAENDEILRQYKDELVKYDAEVDYLKDKQALAEERYQNALDEYNKKVSRLPEESTKLKLDVANSKATLIQVTQDLVDGEEVLIIKRTTYESRLLTHPAVRNAITKSFFPLAMIAEYDIIVNSATELVDKTKQALRSIIRTAVAPAASALKSFIAFCDARPNLKPLSSGINYLAARSGVIKSGFGKAIGPGMEIIGIGLTAWQDGAFSESATLE